MAKRTGNYFYVLSLLLHFTSFYGVPTVTLQLLDHNEKKTESVLVGVPFSINVSIKGSSSDFSKPVLSMDPHFEIVSQGTSSSVSTINGKTTVRQIYNYRSHIDKEGVYTVKPVTITNGSESVSSNELTFNAVKKEVGTSQEESTFLEISIKKKSLFIGEKTSFSLRLYYEDPALKVENIVKPELNNFIATSLKGPSSGTQNRNGKVYNFFEWKSTVYPKKTGEYTIPSVSASIVLPPAESNKEENDILSMIGHVLGHRVKRERLYSNPLTITIKDLPQRSEPVSAVGNFSKLVAKVNVDKVTEGEGIIYTLELIGNGNFSMITHEKIDVPQGLKWYESNTKYRSLAANVAKKDYEYIIQGTAPGKYVIPSQEFSFFNPKIEKYITLKSAPIDIIIEKGKVEKQKENILLDQDKDDQIPLEKVTKWRFRKPKQIPWISFFILCLTPLLLFLLQKIHYAWTDYYIKNESYYKYKNAFKKAKKEINICRDKGVKKELYGICRNLFSARLKVSSGDINKEIIEKHLLERDFSKDTVKSWNNFFDDIVSASFSSLHTMDNEEMCIILLEWISKFENRI